MGRNEQQAGVSYGKVVMPTSKKCQWEPTTFKEPCFLVKNAKYMKVKDFITNFHKKRKPEIPCL